MRKSLFEYSRQKTSEDIYKKITREEKDDLKKFEEYLLISAGQDRVKEALREVLRFREVTGSNLSKVSLEDLRYFLMELKKSEFADYTKNKIRDFIRLFLKWNYKDWSAKFDNFDDIHFNSNAERKKPITEQEIITEEEFKKLLKAEPSLYWKAFLLVQYEGGLRTKETRELLWDNVNFEDEGFTYIKVSSKKNKNATNKIREIPLKNATTFLQELRQQQKNEGLKTKWVFPAHRNPNKCISKSVNEWFNALTKRAIGREINPYLLRHTRGTELRKLVKEGGLSKDNALEFMGHSERMFDKCYSHLKQQDIKKMLKKQLYESEYKIPEEKKHELEIKIDRLEKKDKIRDKEMKQMKDILVKLSEKAKIKS